jgi:polysaccharide export outer membrane protein
MATKTLALQEPIESRYIVRPDGMLTFPLAGEINTTGLSVEEFTAELARRLSEYIIQPKISVNIAKLGTTRVFVLGEVSKPGLHELTKSHRVLDAIGSAQGFTEYAAKKHVFLVRNGDKNNIREINLNNYIAKGDMSQNVVLNEGDCLYLTSNGKISFAKDIMPFISSYYYVKNSSD